MGERLKSFTLALQSSKWQRVEKVRAENDVIVTWVVET